MHLPESRQARLQELKDWEEVIHSSGWRVFLKMMEEHKKYLQGQVNDHLRKHEDRKAGEVLRAMDDCQKMASLVKSRIEKLREKE